MPTNQRGNFFFFTNPRLRSVPVLLCPQLLSDTSTDPWSFGRLRSVPRETREEEKSLSESHEYSVHTPGGQAGDAAISFPALNPFIANRWAAVAWKGSDNKNPSTSPLFSPAALRRPGRSSCWAGALRTAAAAGSRIWGRRRLTCQQSVRLPPHQRSRKGNGASDFPIDTGRLTPPNGHKEPGKTNAYHGCCFEAAERMAERKRRACCCFLQRDS